MRADISHNPIAIFLFSILCAFFCSQCQQRSEIPVAEGTKPINGTELFYKILGEGEPIVVLHGGPGLDHTYLLPHMRELARDFKLILFDQRLSGRSSADVDSSEITIGHFVEDVEGIRTAFGLEKMNLMGHSWGGLLAMFYAIQYPEHLQSLILVNPTAASAEWMQKSMQNQNARFTSADSLARAELLASEAFRNQAASAYAQLFRISFRSTFHNPELVDSLELKLPADFAARSAKMQLLMQDPDVMNYDIHDRLSTITCPTLILHGDADPTPVAAVEDIRDRIEQAELVLMDRCGHFPFIEAPTKFFSEVRTFLTSVTHQ